MVESKLCCVRDGGKKRVLFRTMLECRAAPRVSAAPRAGRRAATSRTARRRARRARRRTRASTPTGRGSRRAGRGRRGSAPRRSRSPRRTPRGRRRSRRARTRRSSCGERRRATVIVLGVKRVEAARRRSAPAPPARSSASTTLPIASACALSAICVPSPGMRAMPWRPRTTAISITPPLRRRRGSSACGCAGRARRRRPRAAWRAGCACGAGAAISWREPVEPALVARRSPPRTRLASRWYAVERALADDLRRPRRRARRRDAAPGSSAPAARRAPSTGLAGRAVRPCRRQTLHLTCVDLRSPRAACRHRL